MNYSIIYYKYYVLGHIEIAYPYWGLKERMPHHYGTQPYVKTNVLGYDLGFTDAMLRGT